jgi:hypothetical protein
MQISTPNEYLYGKGKVMVCERDANGGIGKGIYLGDCPELKFSGSTDKLTHFESETGLNTQDRELVKTVSMEMSVTLQNISADNLALLVWGTQVEVEQAAGVSYTFPSSDIVDGDIYKIPNTINLANAVLVDSAVSPATVSTTKYNVDEDFASVEFLDVATYTQPFKLNYDKGASIRIPMFTSQRPYRYLVFEGINLANPGAVGQKFQVELYNIGFDPATDISMIGDDFGKFELKGSVLVDETRKANSNLGGYGNITKAGAAYVAESSSSSSS